MKICTEAQSTEKVAADSRGFTLMKSKTDYRLISAFGSYPRLSAAIRGHLL